MFLLYLSVCYCDTIVSLHCVRSTGRLSDPASPFALLNLLRLCLVWSHGLPTNITIFTPIVRPGAIIQQ